MPEQFEGDLTGSVFWGADLSDARFRDVDLTGSEISHALLVDVDIDATIDNLVVNGVDVTDYVNERDPWHPLRAMLRPAGPEEMRETWAALEREWAITLEQASALDEDALHESVGGEFSFVQTLRHVVFGIDKWFTAPILGEAYDPIGLPNTGSLEFAWPRLDYDLRPSAEEALAVRTDRADRVRDYLVGMSGVDLTQPVDVLENGPHPVYECLLAVFEEAFWHNRYARRDLATLESRA